jgi:RNA polymerase sigma-70 factor (ECF subfamily)
MLAVKRRTMSSTHAMAGKPEEQATVEALARDYRGVLVRYFERRNVPVADQEDAVQEVFARLLRREGAAPIETPESYLCQTAASVAVDFHRRAVARGRGSHTPYEDRLHAVADFSPERIHGGREDVALVMSALLELPERTRTAFLLARYEKMKLADIAKRLNLSIAGVEKNVRKAMAHLAARLEAQR